MNDNRVTNYKSKRYVSGTIFDPLRLTYSSKRATLSNTTKYKTLSNETFVKVVIGEKQPSILVFGASWSGNSEIMNSMMERVSEEFNSDVNFYKVDIEEEPTIAEFFNVYNVPTTIMIKDGEIVDLVRGFLPASKIRKKISAAYNIKGQR